MTIAAMTAPARGICETRGTRGICGARGTRETRGTRGIWGTQGTRGIWGTRGICGIRGTCGPAWRPSCSSRTSRYPRSCWPRCWNGPPGRFPRLLRDTAAAYAAEGRGFDLREIAGGWRFYTREECAPVVERFISEGQEVRLTQAALETLSVVAYRQPVSRARVSAVRGVNCDGVMRTLTLRGLVEDAGTDPETGAILYRTTGYFLERLGLASLEDLPDLAPFLPDSVEGVEDGADAGEVRP